MVECLAQSPFRWGGVVLFQLNMPGFADSPWEALHFLRSGWDLGWREVGEVEEGKENKLWLK